MSERKVGVLVMSYGTPESMDQIEAYYTDIRRGRPPSPEQLQALIDRYESIVGGFFPLRENTNKQVQALETKLRSMNRGVRFVCYQGLKHAAPFIEDGIRQMAQDGITEAISVVLAPHYSVMSVGAYNDRARQKAAELGISLRCIYSYHLHPKLIKALSDRVAKGLHKFADTDLSDVRVIFTAHSLPEKIMDMNDPYVDQLMASSKAVAEQANISNWQFSWQSAGQSAVPWLGPDILDTLRTIVQEEQVRRVLVCPIGFVSDHLEVLYDLDIEAQRTAQELGLQLERTESLNIDPLYIETLCDVIMDRLNE